MTARHVQHPGDKHMLRLIRRLAALLALLATVAVPPAVLLLAADSPLNPPAALRTRDVLTNPVDDRTLLWLIAAFAWLAYAHLLASLIVELLRQTRGLNWQVPFGGLLFGANTALAGHLIAGILLTSQPAAGVSTATPAMLHAALTTPVLTATTSPGTVAGSLVGTVGGYGTEPAPTSGAGAPQPARPAITETHRLPECRVLPPDGRDHDTLWDIAERHLGDGMRWREIYTLNENRLMPDGQRLTKASLIHPGWILRLPADATTLDIDRVPNQPAQQPAEQPPPATQTVPLEPTPQQAAEVPPRPRLDVDAQDAASRDQVPAPPAPAESSGSVGPPVQAQPVPADQPAHQGGESRAPEATDPTSENDDSQAEDQASADTVTATLGTLALASLGLLGALTRRRKVAARRRPVGARSERPSPELLEEEQRIRHQSRLAETTAATVRLALLLADRHSSRTELKALWQHPDGSLELCWTEPAAAPALAPFHSTDRGWLLPASAQPLLYATRRHAPPDSPDPGSEGTDSFDPVPLLVPVGHRDGSALLVNLELYGAVTLASSKPGSTVPLETLTAWLHCLASTPWSLTVHTHVPTALADLAIGFERITVTDRIAPPVALSDHETEQITALGSVAAARRANPDLYAEDLTVYAGYPPDSIPSDIVEGASRRQLPVALLLLAHPTNSHRADDSASGGPAADVVSDGPRWTFDEHGMLSIPGLGFGITPIRTDHAAHERILRLLEHAQDPPLADIDDPHLAELKALCPPDPRALDDPVPPAVINLNLSCPPARGPVDDDQVLHAPVVALESTPTVVEPEPTPPDEPGSKTAQGKSGPKSAAVPERTSTGPIEIGVLGPATLSGLDMDPPRSITLDLLIYYAFHRRPLSSRELWNGLFPTKPYQDTTLRGRRSELRRLVHPLLHKVGQKHYLDDLATTDWQRFQALADGNPEQQLAALRLIRGRPFDNCQHDWMHLEGQITEIEAAVTDLAIDVAKRALARNDYTTARAAAHAGLLGVPHEERLYRLGMQAAAAAGVTGEVQQLRRQLNVVILDELDPDDEMQPATVELLKTLSDDERRAQFRQDRPRPTA